MGNLAGYTFGQVTGRVHRNLKDKVWSLFDTKCLHCVQEEILVSDRFLLNLASLTSFPSNLIGLAQGLPWQQGGAAQSTGKLIRMHWEVVQTGFGCCVFFFSAWVDDDDDDEDDGDDHMTVQ